MNESETALLDPFEVSTPDEAAELSALARALELAEGFRLIFVRCNQIPQRERLMEEVRARLPKLKTQTLFFRAAIPHLLDAVQPELITPMPDALFVSGLEFSLPVAAEAYATPLIANLNASRNSFAQTLPCPMVLWVPEYVLTAIAQGAPDFFSIRSGVYFFATKAAELATLTHALSAEAFWEIASLSYAEKQDRIVAIKRLLADYELLPKNQQDRRTEQKLLEQLGALFYAQGEYEAALIYYQHCLKLAEVQGNREGVARALHNLGMSYEGQGKLGIALAKYEQAQNIFEALGDEAGVAISLHQLSTMYQDCQDYETARRYLEQAHLIVEKLGDQQGMARSLLELGNLDYLCGKYDAALLHYSQALRLLEEVGDRSGMAASLGQLGRLFIATGSYAQAFNFLLSAWKIFIELQSPYRRTVQHDLRNIREQWLGFDVAWREATGENVPEWFAQEEETKV